jgi:hypothetical protein
LSSQRKTIENKVSQLSDSSLSPSVIESMHRLVEKLKLEFANEEKELKLLLVQDLLALKIAEEAEVVLQSKKGEVEEGKPILNTKIIFGSGLIPICHLNTHKHTHHHN